MFPGNTTLKIIYLDNEEFLKKCREIWNKIIEIIDIDAPHFIRNFVEATLDDNENEYVLLDVYILLFYIIHIYSIYSIILIYSIR